MQVPITPVPPIPPSMYLEMQTPYVQGQPQPPGPYNQPWVAQGTIIPVENQPPDYILWSLFNTLFMNSFLFGFLALIYSIKARDCKVVRDLEGAARFGRTARIFNIVATVTGIIIVIVMIVLTATVLKNATMKWNNVLWSLAQLNSYHRHH